MGRYKRKTIGGAPALAIKLLVVICVVGFAAAMLAGCSASTPPEGSVVNEDDSSFSDGDESIYGEGPTYVEVPSDGRKADVYEFSYTTKRGTELTCVVYDRSGFKEGAGGPVCFEEGPNGGIIAPLPRPQR